ncbi:TonB family protein [Sphingopyxis sp. LK2115]|jgi:TonB family protein|uniref:TonB family protein n=1 Tax=Sphingopyxis sp. LK2115 TaxID=2744558 RepID=UPI0016611D43|nr:TonB family protein [Sphingopyxis sp. LK2115]
MLTTALLLASIPAPVVNVPALSQQLLTWQPGEIRCNGQAVAGAAMRRPDIALATTDPQRMRSIAYRFAIDDAGRPHSIMREGDAFIPFGQDIGPALAASRFPAGAERADCTIRYTPQFASLEQAPIADLAAYSIFPAGPKLPRTGWDRLGAVGNCGDRPRPAVLLRAYPDFSKVAATPGARDWSLVIFDTDADGRPVHARVAHGTDNADLDAAAVEAVRGSRFTGGARTGCLYPYWRAAGRLTAPDKPYEGQMRPADARCPAKIDWAIRPNSSYPPAYRQRAIEGWAILSFDAAPWGEVGNVKLLDAQPSADFGQQAIQILRSGRVAPSTQGATGCVETVQFRMPDQDGQSADEE